MSILVVPLGRARLARDLDMVQTHPGYSVLVVDDDPWVATAISEALQHEGYEVTHSPTAENGFFLACAREFDLIILDWMLPDHDGLSTLRLLRERGLRTPVLMLTARDASSDKVKGLDAGADDYLPKPFDFDEFLARTRALLRRGHCGAGQALAVGDLVLDPNARTARRDGTPLDLTAREFEILEYLVRRAGTVVSRAMMAREIWKRRSYDDSMAATIDVSIARLRKKVDLEGQPRLIHTIRGVGIVLRIEPADA